MTQINLLKNYPITKRDLKVTIGKDQGLNSIFKILSDYGIEISSMRNDKGRLEELFLGLVDSTIIDNKE